VKGRTHFIAVDLQQAFGRDRWFVVSAIAVRAALEEKLRKHALAADVFDELYPEPDDS
jgi:hypothetical protein